MQSYRSLAIVVMVLLIGAMLTAYSASAESTATLTVNVTTYQGSTTTGGNYIVVAATVTANGSPVSGALVTFTDSLGSTFMGSTANTNSSGIALTTVQFTSAYSITKVDTINASASASGYNSGVGSASVTVLPLGSTQLAITPSILNKVATGGSTNIISGKVSYGYNKDWVAGAQVTITDTIGSNFNTVDISSDKNGDFSTNFTIAKVGASVIDLVTVSVSCTGYSPSQSTIILQVAPYSSN